jgi:hypothetical protein
MLAFGIFAVLLFVLFPVFNELGAPWLAVVLPGALIAVVLLIRDNSRS